MGSLGCLCDLYIIRSRCMCVKCCKPLPLSLTPSMEHRAHVAHANTQVVHGAQHKQPAGAAPAARIPESGMETNAPRNSPRGRPCRHRRRAVWEFGACRPALGRSPLAGGGTRRGAAPPHQSSFADFRPGVGRSRSTPHLERFLLRAFNDAREPVLIGQFGDLQVGNGLVEASDRVKVVAEADDLVAPRDA